MSDNDKHNRQENDQFEASAVEMEASGHGGLSQSELDALVASSDTGARTPPGGVGKLILITALCWSLFQLWIASPIPFMVGFGVLNDTETRSIHLAFALFLAYMAYPAERTPFQMVLGVGIPVLMTVLFMVGSKAGVPVWWVPVRCTTALGSRCPAWWRP